MQYLTACAIAVASSLSLGAAHATSDVKIQLVTSPPGTGCESGDVYTTGTCDDLQSLPWDDSTAWVWVVATSEAPWSDTDWIRFGIQHENLTVHDFVTCTSSSIGSEGESGGYSFRVDCATGTDNLVLGFFEVSDASDGTISIVDHDVSPALVLGCTPSDLCGPIDISETLIAPENLQTLDIGTGTMMCGAFCGSSWIGADGADWSVASNWVGGVPTASKSALITSTRCVLSTAGASETCATRVEGSGAVLELLGASTELAGPVDVTTNGELRLNDGETSGPVVVTAAKLTGSGTTHDVTLEALGGIDVGAGDNLIVTGDLVTHDGSTIDIVTGLLDVQGPPPSLAATVTMTSNADISFDGGFTIATAGSLSVTGSSIEANGPLSNNGALNLSNSTLGSGTTALINAGTMTFDGTMTVQPTFLNNAPGDVTFLTGSTTTFASTFVSNTGSSMTYPLGSTLIFTADAIHNGTVTGGGFCVPTSACPPPLGRGEVSAPVAFVLGDLTFGAGASLSIDDLDATVVGNLDIAIDDGDRFAFNAIIRLPAGSHDIEVLAADMGEDVSLDEPDAFTIGSIVVEAGATATLVDNHVNGGGNEVAYVRDLVMAPGSTLDLAGRSLYYGSSVPDNPGDPGSGVDVVDSVGGGSIGMVEPPAVDTDDSIPTVPSSPLVLLAPTPNPFKSSVTVAFGVREAGRVSIDVYDIRGALVRHLEDAHREPGFHSVEWSGRDHTGTAMSSGTYFVRLNSPEGHRTQKVLLVR